MCSQGPALPCHAEQRGALCLLIDRDLLVPLVRFALHAPFTAHSCPHVHAAWQALQHPVTSHAALFLTRPAVGLSYLQGSLAEAMSLPSPLVQRLREEVGQAGMQLQSGR